MDTLDDFIRARPPTAARPLLGLTVLLVEDSRYASEAFRLMCLRSGARIRRADSIDAARKHLRIYMPIAAIIDLGLPDGNGLALIDELNAATPRIDILLATSGDTSLEHAAMAAGADGFLGKPVDRLAEFQAAVLQHLPADRQPPGPRVVHDERIFPDSIAFRDDLEHVANVLSAQSGRDTLDYAQTFLGGIAISAGDTDLEDAVNHIAAAQAEASDIHAHIAALSSLVQERLASTSAF